jgi:hypothetical protein
MIQCPMSNDSQTVEKILKDIGDTEASELMYCRDINNCIALIYRNLLVDS